MASMSVPQGVKGSTITASITRADGTVVELGVVSYHHSSFIKRTWLRLRSHFGRPVTERDIYA